MPTARPMHITIGEARSLTTPESWTYTPDDRQTQVQTFDGVVVQDYGWKYSGDKMGFSATFWLEDFWKIVGYWSNREKVTIKDMSGIEWPGCRVIIKSYSYINYFETRAVKMVLEIWRV